MSSSRKSRADRLALAVQKKLLKATAKALKAAGRLLEAEVKKTLNVPAPRKRVKPRDGSPPYWRATTAAAPGAPPRRVSGDLRKSVKAVLKGPLQLHVVVPVRSKPRGSRPGGFRYGRYHEVAGLGKKSGMHPFLRPTWQRVKPNFLTVLRRNVTAELRY